MDGMLSQDEINALLGGIDDNADSSATQTPPQAPTYDENSLTEVEKDAIGEVANISMGTSATTLYSLVNRKVQITTPTVSLSNWEELAEGSNMPYVFIQIGYTSGLDGKNILILEEKDVKVITDLMMGGDGTNIDDELGELHLSAISEAMNQMMGSAATSLSQMLGTVIDISPPIATRVDINNSAQIANDESAKEFLGGTFVRIAFTMQIEGLVDSTILQLYPIDFAKSLITTFLGESEVSKPQVKAFEPPRVEPQIDTSQIQQMQQQMNPMGMQGMPMSQMSQIPPMYQMPPMYQTPPAGTNYQPASFEQFAGNVPTMPSNENIGLIMDVPLEVTVELGRTKKNIAEILDFAPGTIIELNRIAGEEIDVLVNGKMVAKGEVVVIEENFGIRVTEIIK